MLSSLPCFYAFCWSAIPTSGYIFNDFYSCSCHLFSSRCMLELKFAIYYRAASLPPQASYAVLPEESQAFFKHYQQYSNSAILRNNYVSLLSDLCACVHVKKKWRRKGSHSFSVSGSNRLVWLQTWKKAMGWCTAQWKMLLFCVKTNAKESRKFELARLKKKKENILAIWRLSGSVLSRCFLAPLDVFFVMKTLKNEQ